MSSTQQFLTLFSILDRMISENNPVWTLFLEHVNETKELADTIAMVPEEEKIRSLKNLYLHFGPPPTKYGYTYRCDQCPKVHSVKTDVVLLVYEETKTTETESLISELKHKNIVKKVLKNIHLGTVHESSIDLLIRPLDVIEYGIMLTTSGDLDDESGRLIVSLSEFDDFVDNFHRQGKEAAGFLMNNPQSQLH